MSFSWVYHSENAFDDLVIIFEMFNEDDSLDMILFEIAGVYNPLFE